MNTYRAGAITQDFNANIKLFPTTHKLKLKNAQTIV